MSEVDPMGTFDKLKQKAQQFGRDNSEKVREGVDKMAEAAKKRTGGKYDDRIDQGAQQVHQRLGGQRPESGQQPPQDQPPAGQ
jgi:hypothetical protein